MKQTITFFLTLFLTLTTTATVFAAKQYAFDSPGAAIEASLAQINATHPAQATLAISSLQRNDFFAIAYLRSTADIPEYPDPAIILAVFSRLDGWLAYAPGITTAVQFNQILAGFPADLIDEDTKNYLSIPIKPEMSIQSISGHKLPWQNGTTAVVTQKDGSSHFNQIDFAIINDSVVASKPGTVLYVKESSPDPPGPECINDGVTWKKGNYVVIRHTATEYSWYYHLTYNSVPVKAGDSIGYGTRIGTEGRTGYTCGPTGIHLHYMASTWAPTTFPDPSIIDAAAWPLIDTITDANFSEVSWANILVGSTYTSQNVSNTNPSGPLPANAVFCASQNALCNFDGIGTVYFGADETYGSLPNIKMSVECSTTVFGDPLPGSAKQCYYVITAPAPNCPAVTNAARLFDGTACSSSYINAALGLIKLEANNFNDIAESIALPNGWSARLFQNNNETMADSLCLGASDKNLNDNTYLNSRNAGNSATWVRVYNTNTCASTLPGTFNKTLPADGATSQSTSPTLSWSAASNATGYDYCYDTSNDGVCSNWISKGTTPSKTLIGLLPATTYYWQVRATNSGGFTYANTAAGSFWSFTTQENVTDFSKSSPTNAASGVSTSPTLRWAVLNGAIAYEVCFDTSDDNTCSNWTSTATATSKAISGLSPQTIYFWQVRANTPTGIVYANNSTFWKFTTLAAKPAKPTSLSASDGVFEDKVALTWAQTAGATTYKVYRNTSVTFPSTTFASNLTNPSYNDTSAAAGKTYYYWVKACNTLGCSVASAYDTGFKKTTSLPDLIITKITINPLSPALGQTFSVLVKVKNQGSVASSAFRLIFNMDTPPTACPATGAGYYDIASLAAGGTKEYTFTARYDSGLSHNLYALADSKCQVAEGNEANNTFGPTQVNLLGGP